MLLNFLHRLIALAVLVPLGSMAQQVPIRGLLAEQADAGQGEAAIVHTHYGTAYGFFLTGEAEVLVSRHAVLTPQRTIASEIGVKYPQKPFNNFIESPSIPIAQDIAHDLVLLRIVDTDAAAETVPPVQAAAVSPPCTPLQQVHRRIRHRERHSYLRQARFTRRNTKASLRRTLAFRRNPQLHIIWDGPRAGSS